MSNLEAELLVNESLATLGLRTGTRIRILGSAPGPSAASLAEERRRGGRRSPTDTQWADAARLRTGHDVRVVDISTRGVLITAPISLHVGARLEICLTEADTNERLVLSGIARRCQVAGLNPMTFTGAVEFDQEIELRALQPFMASEARSA